MLSANRDSQEKIDEEEDEFEQRMLMHAINMQDRRNSKTPQTGRVEKLRRAATGESFEQSI